MHCNLHDGRSGTMHFAERAAGPDWSPGIRSPAKYAFRAHGHRRLRLATRRDAGAKLRLVRRHSSHADDMSRHASPGRQLFLQNYYSKPIFLRFR